MATGASKNRHILADNLQIPSSCATTHNIRTNEDVHCLRIRSGATTPMSPLVPSKVEGLDTLSWHVGSVVEDKSKVS